MKKYNNQRNIVGKTIKKYREKRHISKISLSNKLELLGVGLDRFELYKIESGKMIVKDFELIALCVALDINFEEIKKQLDS